MCPETLSRAVLRSLQGEASARYTSARELALALEDGLAGREPAVPGEATTSALGVGLITDATRRLEAEDPATPVAPQPVAPQRAAPRPAPRPVITPAQRAKRSAFSSFARGVGILILIALLAAIIATVVLIVTDAGQGTDLGQLIKDNLDEQIQALRDLLSELAAGQLMRRGDAGRATVLGLSAPQGRRAPVLTGFDRSA